ncbi:unnamed protein product [Spodoptera littoralis]|uniref:DUF753 domain-containing protein n=1 Tax=Spodoptera littoralis TaxID=7109 RepID=A0A9P0I2U2_SPOLI|nr:unnamed protein product [Spodoptera littoralis]CAH1639148.1 unnamed protein product [Spodoptera littoralis]
MRYTDVVGADSSKVIGSLQETYKEHDYHLSPSEVGKSPGSEWPVQTYNTFGGSFPLPPKIETELNTVIVSSTPKPQPKSLRNRANNLNAVDSYSKPNLPDDSIYKSRNSITITNPVIDSFEENHRQILTKDDEDDTTEPLPVPLLHPMPVTAPLPNPTRRNLNQSPNNKSYLPKPVSPIHSAPDTENENQLISTLNSATVPRTEYNPPLTSDSNPLKTYNSLPESVAKSEPEVTLTASNKCDQDKEVEDIGNTRRSMSNHDDGEKFPNKDTHARYTERNTDNENAMASVLNVEKSSKSDDAVLLDKTKLLRERTESHVRRPQYSERRNEIMEPTKGDGVVNMGQSSLMMMQTDRICYACSTANNPSCTDPDRRTTVKYCRKENNACITKTFGKGNTFTLIRDCGKTCDDADANSLMPRYKTCSICHSDLCNGAYSINGHSILFAFILTALVKYLN